MEGQYGSVGLQPAPQGQSPKRGNSSGGNAPTLALWARNIGCSGTRQLHYNPGAFMVARVFDDRRRSGGEWEQAVDIAIRIFLLMALVFLPLFVCSAFAGIHPVPLE